MLAEVESQLEILNQSASQINDLENQLLAARASFHTALSEQSDKLKSLSTKLGKCVHKARPFYDARSKQFTLLQQIQVAAEKYNLAINTLSSTRDSLSRLEQIKCTAASPVELDAMESLNRSVLQLFAEFGLYSRVNNAMKNVSETKAEHERLLRSYNEAERVVHQLERKHKSAIRKARPYFIHKQFFDQRMQEAKLRVDICAEKVQLCKALYSEAMVELERISESLHMQSPAVTYKFIGQDDDVPDSSLVRGQGVGAESPDAAESPILSSSRRSLKDLLAPVSVQMTEHTPTSSKRSSYRGQSPRLLMSDLLEHVQDAQSELNAIRLVVNSPVAIPDSVLNSVSQFTVPMSPTDLASVSSVLCPRPVTPGDEGAT